MWNRKRTPQTSRIAATPQAAQGLDDGNCPVVVREDAAGAGDAVLELFDDPARGRALGNAAAAFVRERFQWSVMHRRFQDAWQPQVDARLNDPRGGR